MNVQNSEKNTDRDVIDLRVVFRDLWRRKWLFVKVWIITFVLACVYIMPQPRTYVTSLSLAPELGGHSSGGALSSLASSFGFDIGGIQTEDAFYPELYPDLMATNEFLVDLLYVNVKTLEGDVDTTYLCYLAKYQKKNPLSAPWRWCKKQLRNLFSDSSKGVSMEERLDPRRLSKEDDELVSLVRNNITCDVDLKTNVITITVKDQDPQICVTMADSACVRLQEFITNYRTSKARIDLQYYESLADSARMEYDAAVSAYSRYCDSHQNVILQAYATERDKLEYEMQSKQTTYNAMNTQYQAAKAKVQERTPAFTVLSSAVLPVKADSPKRMIFVAAMLFLAFFGTCFWIFRKDISAHLLGQTKEEELVESEDEGVEVAENEE